jgi:hypothetical protein
MNAEAVQFTCIQYYSGCTEHEGFRGGHEGAYPVAILEHAEAVNVCITCIVAVETMRALEEAIRVLTLWQFLNMQRLSMYASRV